MNPIERSLRRLDALQQGHTIPGLVFGVVKKYGDDNAGALTVQLTYSMFTAVFPLLLLLVTVLGLVLASHPSLRHDVLHSTFSQFPIVGTQLSNNVHALRRDSTFGLVIGLVGLIYGSTGLAGTGLHAMSQIWNIPGAARPNFWVRRLRSLLFLGMLGGGLVVTTVLSSFGTFGRHDFWLGVGAEVLAGIVNVCLYVGGYRVLTPKRVDTRSLVPGAVLAGIVWTVLQAFGGYVVGHYLRNDNAVYGVFGTVLGLLAWIYIGAEVTIYAAELNAVLARRLWPRSLVQPPLTKADQLSISWQATENQRRPEQEVISVVRGRPMSQAEYLDRGEAVDPDAIATVERAPEPPGNEDGARGDHELEP